MFGIPEHLQSQPIRCIVWDIMRVFKLEHVWSRNIRLLARGGDDRVLSVDDTISVAKTVSFEVLSE